MVDPVGEILSTKEAARLAGVSIDTIYRWIREGALKTSQPGLKTGSVTTRGARHLINRVDLLTLAPPGGRTKAEGAT